MKRYISVLVSVLLLVSIVLTGCGTGSTTPAVSANVKDASTSSAEGTKAVEATAQSDKKVTLSLLSWYNEESWKPVLQQFNQKNPNISIDIQFAPPVQQYVEKAKVLFASGEPTDMFYTAAENHDEVLNNGYAADISNLPIISKISKISTSYFSKDGKVYAMGVDAWITGVLYNKKIFDAVGVKPPTNWSEFIDVLKKIKTAGYIPIATNKEGVHDYAEWLNIADVISQNPNYDSEVNSGKKTYADGWTDPMKTWYNDLIKTGLIGKEVLGMNGQQAEDLFATEKAAILQGAGPWSIDPLKKKNPNLQMDMFPFVGTKGTPMLQGAPNVALTISAKTKNMDAAKTFLNWIGTTEGLQAYRKMTGQVLLVDGVDYQIDPVIGQFKDKALKGEFYLSQIYWKHSAAIYQELLRGCQDVIAGAAKPEDIPKKMDAKKAELDKAGAN